MEYRSIFQERLFDFIDWANRQRSAQALESKFLDIMSDEGFHIVGARTIGNPFAENFDSAPVLYNGPEELFRIWHERGYIRNDPTILRALTTQLPFLWTSNDGRTPIGKRILSDAADFGITEGIALPVHSLDQNPACISLSGARAKDLRREDAMTLGLAASHFFITWTELLGEPAEEVERLTPRERDVLYCACAGYSGPQISDRLGIGSESVKSHMKSIREKLGASSIAHAVAKAIRAGVIFP